MDPAVTVTRTLFLELRWSGQRRRRKDALTTILTQKPVEDSLRRLQGHKEATCALAEVGGLRM